jgi:hypothetical protein
MRPAAAKARFGSRLCRLSLAAAKARRADDAHAHLGPLAVLASSGFRSKDHDAIRDSDGSLDADGAGWRRSRRRRRRRPRMVLAPPA